MKKINKTTALELDKTSIQKKRSQAQAQNPETIILKISNALKTLKCKE